MRGGFPGQRDRWSSPTTRPARCHIPLWSSESGIPADPLAAGLSCGFTKCCGWCSNRYPLLIPQVIPRVHPQRKPLYTFMISGFVTESGCTGASLPWLGICRWREPPRRGRRERLSGSGGGIIEKITIGGDGELPRDPYELLRLFGDKWVSSILFTLAGGPMWRVRILCAVRLFSIGREWSGKSAVPHDSILARTLKKMAANDC